MDPIYLFRGQLLKDVYQVDDLTVGTDVFTQRETRAKTYNFTKYSHQLDEEDAKKGSAISEMQEYYDFVNELKGKYR